MSLVALAGACATPPSAAHAPDAGALCGTVERGAIVTPVAATPEDMPRLGCSPGAFSDFDPTGVWFLHRGVHGLGDTGPVRLELSCEGGLRAFWGGLEPVAADYTLATADELFWRRERVIGTTAIIEAYNLCGVDEHGDLVGAVQLCLASDDTRCSPDRVVATRVERLPGEVEADGFELVAELGADWPGILTSDVRVRGGVAYVARGTDGLRIVDVSEPASPREVGHLPAADNDFRELELVDGPDGRRYAVVAGDITGAPIVDVTDPTAPVLVTLMRPTESFAHGVHTLFVETVDGVTRAYLADGFSRVLAIFDVTDPRQPVRVGQFDVPGVEEVHAVHVRAGRAYVSGGKGGWVVVDTLPDPAHPTVVGYYRDGVSYAHQSWFARVAGRDVLLVGNEGYGAHLEIVDADDASATFMQRIGALPWRPEVSIHDIRVEGGMAYLAHYQDGVRRVDISDPTAPRLAGYFNTWDPQAALGLVFEGAFGLDVDDGYVFVADAPRGLLVLRDTY